MTSLQQILQMGQQMQTRQAFWAKAVPLRECLLVVHVQEGDLQAAGGGDRS